MNSRFLFTACVFCWITLLIQEGESTDPIWVVGASTTVSLGGLVAGALLLKAGAAAIFGLVSLAANRRGGRRGYRGKREISEGLEIDEIDLEVLQKEAEVIFSQLDETDPARCFRRYICELSSGKIQDVPEDHVAILNLVAQPIAIQGKSYEYRIASSIGFASHDSDICQQLYECALSGSEIDKLFV